MDLECYHEYFLAKFFDERTRQFYQTSSYPGQDLDIQYIVNLLHAFTIYTFNGNHYDIPMLTLAMHGATNEYLKNANDAIIKDNLKSWQFYDRFKIQPHAALDHVDLFDVAPGVGIGLKMYMGRLHAPKMQDLPFDPDERPDAMKRFVLNDYCSNDLIGTNLLRHEVWDRVQLRVAMSAKYGIDLRSKSDAQIAEAVIKAELGFSPNKRYIKHGYTFGYDAPAYLRYVTPGLRTLLDTITAADFEVSDKEQSIAMNGGDGDGIRTGVVLPKWLAGKDIVIGQAKYRMGIGGLHSQEASVYHVTDSEYLIMDVDVKSYYPSLIINMGMVPEQLGAKFLDIFKSIYDTRLIAKEDAPKLLDLGFLEDAREQQTIADGLKIVLNGTFGKLWSKYSILYAPELGVRTTITGQLALLMLIEMMELSGIQVVSANTDGIVLKVPRILLQQAKGVVAWWERATGLEMEYSPYRAIYSRDVNNYIAITDTGKVKRKGTFNNGGVLSGPAGKGPDMDICGDAVVAYLKDGTPITETVHNCKDIRKFVTIRKVKGGAVDLPEGIAINDGKYLGKAVRWYHGNRRGYIGYAGTGSRVAGSDHATPLMELPLFLPADLNHQHYIAVAMEMLKDLGVTQ